MPDLHSPLPMSQADHLYRELGEAKRQLGELQVAVRDLLEEIGTPAQAPEWPPFARLRNLVAPPR